MKTEIACKKCNAKDKWIEAKKIDGWGTRLKCECGFWADTGFTIVELVK